ncbi:MAG: ABC transporter ATP-binding protein [Deltaproteobacteria bacterium]|nr:ABC transporter ATP-binding protein [Deltaproteobacteria bacterium]
MLECRDISKTYHSGRGKLHALRGVSLKIVPGAAAAIVGKSGSGKTTLLNCMGGLDRPDSGTVFVKGFDLHALSPHALSLFLRRDMGFVFQFGNLLSYLTVFENIAFPLRLNGASNRKLEHRTQELLDRIGLSGAGPALPHELSGGEVQRVAVARALAHRPRLLLADEPTASLDSTTGTTLVRLMFEMGRESGCTMVLSTHDSEVMDLADQCLHIRDGLLQGQENSDQTG